MEMAKKQKTNSRHKIFQNNEFTTVTNFKDTPTHIDTHVQMRTDRQRIAFKRKNLIHTRTHAHKQINS